MKNQYIRQAQYKKGFASLVLIGVVFVLIAVGGYFLWHKKAEAPVPVAEPVAQTPVVTTTTQTNDNISTIPKPTITPLQKSVVSYMQVEFTFLAPKGNMISRFYISCDPELSANFNDNVTPRTTKPYPDICNTWQNNSVNTIQLNSVMVQDIRDVLFINGTEQTKTASLQITTTMPNGSVVKSDISHIIVLPTPNTYPL